ncbi:MAG: GGDEF domain-containing protein [Bacilli bacterium]
MREIVKKAYGYLYFCFIIFLLLLITVIGNDSLLARPIELTLLLMMNVVVMVYADSLYHIPKYFFIASMACITVFWGIESEILLSQLIILLVEIRKHSKDGSFNTYVPLSVKQLLLSVSFAMFYPIERMGEPIDTVYLFVLYCFFFEWLVFILDQYIAQLEINVTYLIKHSFMGVVHFIWTCLVTMSALYAFHEDHIFLYCFILFVFLVTYHMYQVIQFFIIDNQIYEEMITQTGDLFIIEDIVLSFLKFQKIMEQCTPKIKMKFYLSSHYFQMWKPNWLILSVSQIEVEILDNGFLDYIDSIRNPYEAIRNEFMCLRCLNYLKVENITSFTTYEMNHYGKHEGIIVYYSDAWKAITPSTIKLLTYISMRFEELLRRSAVHNCINSIIGMDELTKVYTREVLHKRFNTLEKLEIRGKAVFAVMDLDFFKQINDTYGHAAGNDVLVQFGALLTSFFEPYANSYRIGGEEFALLFHRVYVHMAPSLLHSFRKYVENYHFTTKNYLVGSKTERKLHVTVSIGWTSFGIGEIFERQVLQDADYALYHDAKLKGRNTVGKYDGKRM